MHQEVAPDEAVSVLAAIEVVTEGVGVDDEDLVEAAQNPRRRNGSQSRSWADSSKQGRSQAWSKSTYIHFRSRSIKLWIGSCPS
jgi:hypothetical protein